MQHGGAFNLSLKEFFLNVKPSRKDYFLCSRFMGNTFRSLGKFITSINRNICVWRDTSVDHVEQRDWGSVYLLVEV